ncbi:MAG: hypothetical protein P4L43_16470 [Syntrophobacteraceae bacterium]|nr:hypothetical protein [Syntrophobacteraceae bacterium]
MVRAVQGLDGFMNPLIGNLAPSDTIYAVELMANTSQQVAIPTGANLVVFGAIPGANQFVKFVNSAISVPTTTIVDGSAPERIPDSRNCAGKAYISLVSDISGVVTLAFYV